MQKRGSRRYERKPYYIRNLRKILDGMTLTSIILLTNTKSGIEPSRVRDIYNLVLLSKQSKILLETFLYDTSNNRSHYGGNMFG